MKNDMHPIKKRRVPRFLNLVDLAKLADLSNALISYMEAGIQPCSKTTLDKIAPALGISTKVLGAEIRDWEARNLELHYKE